MEEDIKIVESLIEEFKKDDRVIFNNVGLRKEIEFKAIKNLLKRYKELEEENNRKNIEPVIINNKMYFIDNELYKDLLKDIKTDYIPISVIQNKIEELDKEKLKYDNDLRIYTLRNTFDFQKEVLQELLEERNK